MIEPATSVSKLSKLKMHPLFLTSEPSSSKPINRTTNLPRSYIPTYCNFYFWLLIFPFRITWCHSSARHTYTTSKLQRSLCRVIHTVALLATTPYLLGFFYHLNRAWTEPTYILTSATNITCYLVTIDFLKIVWWNGDKILEIANWHVKMNVVHQIFMPKIVLLCLVPCAASLLNNPLADIVKEFAVISSNETYPSYRTSILNTSEIFHGPLHILLFICLMCGHLFFLVSTGFTLALTLSIKQSLTQMINRKNPNQRSPDLDLYQGINTETEIRNLLTNTNAIIGNKVLLEYLMMLSFYATILEFFAANYTQSEFSRWHVLLYLAFSGTFWLSACEIHCLARSYWKEWVQLYRSKCLMTSPNSLKHYPTCLVAMECEADLNPVCISCRCFNITYGFLGSMCGLIITYSTIVYQMKTDKG